MELSKIKVGKRFRKDLGDLDSLCESIQQIGLMHPVVIDEDNNLIAGLRRLEACKKLGLEDIPVRIVNLKDTLRGQTDENAIRKNFTPSEAVAIWEAMESYQGQKLVSNFDTSEKRRNRASKLLGLSTYTLSKAKQVVDSGDQELIEEMDRTGNVHAVYRKLKQKEDEKKILERTPLAEMEGKFKTVVIDPPWDYMGLSLAGRGKPEYAVMSLERLREYDLMSLADNSGCHIYLWTTNNFLYEALKLGEAWGFQYKTTLTWVKPSIGLGSYFRNSTEHCLFFVLGHLQTRANNIPTHFEAGRSKHSEKPEIFYNIAEKASYPPRLEIFGTKPREGWTVWGNFDV
ncbi:MAG: MT-A70 family methyltransferase [Thermodesulfovibrionales bacterium]